MSIKQEENKLKEKLAKQAANERYGSLLRAQVQDYEQRKHQEHLSNESFASLESDKAQKMADMQNKRTQDARNRHEQFVRNAMEDIALKESLKQSELKADLRASTIMVNNAKKYLGMLVVNVGMYFSNVFLGTISNFVFPQ